MSGKIFVVAFLFLMGAFCLLAILFNFYPPAANSIWTLLGVALYAALAIVVTRRVAGR